MQAPPPAEYAPVWALFIRHVFFQELLLIKLRQVRTVPNLLVENCWDRTFTGDSLCNPAKSIIHW